MAVNLCEKQKDRRFESYIAIKLQEVISLKLSGSKLTIDYGVKAHRGTEYKNSAKHSRKGDSGLWFESILINKELKRR